MKKMNSLKEFKKYKIKTLYLGMGNTVVNSEKDGYLCEDINEAVAELRKEIKKIRTKYNKLDPYTKRKLYCLECCLKTINRKITELFGCEKPTAEVLPKTESFPSVVGSQNRDVRDVFLKSLGHGKSKIEGKNE